VWGEKNYGNLSLSEILARGAVALSGLKIFNRVANHALEWAKLR